MAKTFLFKTEPSEYSFGDLVRDGRTAWTGVKNPGALIALRACAKGDLVLIYHTAGEKAVVGVAEVARAAYPDPDAKGDEKAVAVDLKPVRALAMPVTLAAIKGDRRFADFALVRQSRLSVMEVPGPLAAAILGMAGG